MGKLRLREGRRLFRVTQHAAAEAQLGSPIGLLVRLLIKSPKSSAHKWKSCGVNPNCSF
jgi:hypothetical protein